MNDDQQLLYRQYQAWIREQEMLQGQIERTIQHHKDMTIVNLEQLAIQNKRLDMAKAEFEAWMLEHGFDPSENWK